MTSLEASIAESIDRLAPALKRALVRCSVFSGGFDLEAAEHVVSGPGHTWDHLQELQERSLLTLDALGSTPRLKMLESIRDYLRRFPSERETARRAHAAYFAAVALDREREIVSPKAVPALAWFERERLNLRHALDGLEPSEPLEAVRVALAVETFAAVRGNGQERRALLDRAVRCAVTDGDCLRRRALLSRARFLATSSDAAQAALDVEEADALGEDTPPALLEIRLAARQFSPSFGLHEIDDVLARCSPGSLTEARVLGQRGIGRSLAGDGERGVADLRRAVAIAGSAGAIVTEAVFNVTLGVLLLRSGQAEAAEGCLTVCQPVLDAIGHRRMQPFVLRSLSLIHAARDDTSTATEMLETALRDSGEMQDRVGVGVCRLYLGLVAWRAGSVAQARVHFEEATEVSPTPVPGPLWSVGACLAALDALDGDQPAAERGHQEALRQVEAAAAGTTSEARLIRALGLVVMSERARVSNEASDFARVLDAATDATAASAEIAVIAPILSDAVRRSAFRAAERGHVHGSSPGLVVGAGGAWARLPDGEITDLRSRSNAQRVLWALATERVDRPGAGLNAEALFRLVWPGERADKISRRNRVRVAVAELRKRGLRALLIRDATGYRFREDVPTSLERYI